MKYKVELLLVRIGCHFVKIVFQSNQLIQLFNDRISKSDEAFQIGLNSQIEDQTHIHTS